MNYVLFIVALILGIAVFGANLYFIIKFIKRPPLGDAKPKIEGKLKYILLATNFGVGIFTILSSIGLTMMLPEGQFLDSGEMTMNVFGSYIFATSVSLLVSSFTLYYYLPNLEQRQKKTARIITFATIPFIIAGLWLLTDAFALHVQYPLINAISFTRGFVSSRTEGDLGFNIKFYGILIVLGAGLSYVIADHTFYKEFGKHGIIDTLLIVAFPAGIIGARIWYCTILEPGTNIFAIREGGLAIQGGALGGIVVGVAFMLIFRRYVNIRWAMDVIVPTILLAQMIGRWGNFFNNEVHGMAVNMSDWWFLPKMITHNMQYSSTTSSLAGSEQMYLPLFLIEGVTNTIGYFFIRYGVGKACKRWTSLGDLSMWYVIWYGVTRYLLEPLRSGSYEYNQSWIMSITMIVGGVVGIILFHLYDFIRLKVIKKPTHFIKKEYKDKDKKQLLIEQYKNNLANVNNQVVALYKTIKDLDMMEKYLSNYYYQGNAFYLNRIDLPCLYKIESKLIADTKAKRALNPLASEHVDNNEIVVSYDNDIKDICVKCDIEELIPIWVNSLTNPYKNARHINVSLTSNPTDERINLKIVKA